MSVVGRRGTFRALNLGFSASVASNCLLRSFSVFNRPSPNYPGHVPLTFAERGALAVGSAVGSLLNPRRAGKFLLASIIVRFILLRCLQQGIA